MASSASSRPSRPSPTGASPHPEAGWRARPGDALQSAAEVRPMTLDIRVAALAWALASLTVPGASAQSHAAPAAAAMPPVIDRELFFGNPEISGAQLSPDGNYIAFIKPYKDTRNVWVKKRAEPYTAARLLTSDTKRPISQCFWSRDSKYVLFVQDNAGDENFNVFAVDPAAAPAAGAEVPPARNLTAAKGARAFIYER